MVCSKRAWRSTCSGCSGRLGQYADLVAESGLPSHRCLWEDDYLYWLPATCATDATLVSKSAVEDAVKREKMFYDVLAGGILYSSLKSSRVPRFPRLKRTLTSEELSKMRRGGRPRIYASNAERQRAWYARQKARVKYYKSEHDLK